MSKVSIIEYKGKKIIFIDAKKSTKEEGMKNFEEFDKLVRTFPPKSLLMLHDVTDKEYNKEAMNKWKEASSEHEKYVIKSAIVGAKGLMGVMILGYRTFTRLRGLNVDNIVYPFDTIEQAKDWLVKD